MWWGVQDGVSKIKSFQTTLDWNRYNTNDKTGVKINTQTISPIWCPSNNKSNTIENRRRQGARNTIINFCKLLRPNNHLTIFFKVQSIKNLSHLNTTF